MNKYFTLINIVIHFVINPVFVNYSYSNNEIKYLKVKSFNLNNNPFDYNSLKKIVFPITFPNIICQEEKHVKLIGIVHGQIQYHYMEMKIFYSDFWIIQRLCVQKMVFVFIWAQEKKIKYFSR